VLSGGVAIHRHLSDKIISLIRFEQTRKAFGTF